MEKKLVPTHKYKTTVLFYDDNLDYINFLQSNLKSNKYNFIFVSNINDFYNNIKKSAIISERLSQPFKLLDIELSDDPRHEIFDFDISEINKLIKLDDKVSEISTVFIDNNLRNSDFNGLSICDNIGETSFNKVLLTGECDRIDAINALNEKIIDMYIEKYDINHNAINNMNIIEKIIFELNKLTDIFFINKNSYINILLSNVDFKLLFNKLINEYDIIDYYLFDKETFKLVDSKNNNIFFKCWTEDKFNEYFKNYYDELNENKTVDLMSIKIDKMMPTKSGLKIPNKFKNLYYCVF